MDLILPQSSPRCRRRIVPTIRIAIFSCEFAENRSIALDKVRHSVLRAVTNVLRRTIFTRNQFEDNPSTGPIRMDRRVRYVREDAESHNTDRHLLAALS